MIICFVLISYQKALQANAVHVGSKVDPWSKEELEKMISARIDLPIVRSLLDAGFKKPLIKLVLLITFSGNLH